MLVNKIFGSLTWTMFLVMSVCLSLHKSGPRVTPTHDAIIPNSTGPLSSRYQTWDPSASLPLPVPTSSCMEKGGTHPIGMLPCRVD